MKKKVIHIVGKCSYDGTALYAIRLCEALKEFQSKIVFCYTGSADIELQSSALEYHTIINKSRISKTDIFIKFRCGE